MGHRRRLTAQRTIYTWSFLRQISCSPFWSVVTFVDTSDNAFYSSRQWCIVLLTTIFSSGRPAEGPRLSGRGPETNRRPPCGRAKASLQSTCVLPLPSVRPPGRRPREGHAFPLRGVWGVQSTCPWYSFGFLGTSRRPPRGIPAAHTRYRCAIAAA